MAQIKPLGLPVEHMGVDHGGFNFIISKQFLDETNVMAGFQEVGAKGMRKSFGGDAFFTCGLDGHRQ